jgi:PAS domain S-box-containing protein
MQPREQLDRFFEISHDLLCIAGFDGYFKSLNSAWERALGFTKEELLATPYIELVHPDDRDSTIAEAQTIAVTGNPLTSFENRYRCKDGSYKWLQWIATPLHDQPLIYAAAQDVTEHRRSEERILRLAQAVENSTEMIAIGDCEGRVTFANQALLGVLGYSEEEILGKSFESTILSPKNRSGLDEEIRLQILQKGGWKGECLHRRKDGSDFAVYLSVAPIKDRAGCVIGSVGIAHDINESKRAEERLRQSEQSYRTLVEQCPDAMLIHRQGTIALANSACASLFGAPSADALFGKQMLDFVHPDNREAVKQRLQKYGQDTNYIRQNETKLIRPDGVEKYAEVVARSIIYQGELAFQVTYRDMSQRRQAEQELRQSEQNLATAQRMAHLGSFEYGLTNPGDLDKMPVQWSDEVFRIFGYEPGQINVTRAVFLRAVHPDDRDRVLNVATKATQERRGHGVEYRVIRPDGIERIVHGELNIVCDEKTGTPLRTVGTIQDITESKHLEKMFLQAQKMEAVGRLSGGVAHDFNNLLMVIMGYADVLVDRLGENDVLRRKAEEIKKAGQRAASLTRQLLAFSRQQVLQPTVVNLNSVVTDVKKMLGRLIGEDIELVTVLSPDLGQIKADQGQIEQVIVNLAVNARDAMPRGGKLTAETANIEVDDAYAREQGNVSPGSFIMLTVTDTGVGMDAETQSHIFEPFFTTKERGKGTGLGLATVYGVVKQSGGFIWVYSEPGHGTRFKILLPRVEEPAHAVTQNASSEASYGGSETILLAEDEESLRQLLMNILSEYGYTVLEAANGPQALGIARQYQGQIHLLVTDVVMPGMSGPQLATELGPVRPNIKVLYMSGYTEFAAGHTEIPQRGRLLLQKPFTRQSLADKVRQALGSDADFKSRAQPNRNSTA